MAADLRVQRFRFFVLSLLRRRRFRLVLRLPFIERHAVYDLARLLLVHIDAACFRGGQVPLPQAIAAETGKIHEVDILHIRALYIVAIARASLR